jgi:U4/U6.U5 tri-snRNP component SNU23
MRVEHSTLEQVKNRLAMHKDRAKQEAEKQKAAAADPNAHFVEYERKMRAQAEEEEARKSNKKQRVKEKQRSKGDKDEGGVPAGYEGAGAGGDEVTGADAEMMAMMGFGGFGSSSKKS